MPTNVKEITQAKIAAAVSAVSGFVGYMATLPPEQQDAVTGPIVALIPLSWRPEVGLVFKAVFTLSTFWGIYKAAHSSGNPQPPTPPQSKTP